MESTYPQNNAGLKLMVIGGALVLFILLAALLPSIPVVNGTHAEEKHGTNINSIRSCSDPEGVYFNPHTKRTACVFKVDGHFGIRIFKEENGVYKEITTFFKEKMTKLSQVEKYLSNVGYK
jgi:hypothetical protein